METYRDVRALCAAAGRTLGPTDWLVIEQDRVDRYAAAVGRPVGMSVCDGHFMLSLIPRFVGRLRRIEGLAMGVNYGADRVRFPSPVHVGDRVRGRTTLLTATELDGRSVQLVARTSIEIAGSDEPVCVADLVSRVWFRAAPEILVGDAHA